MVTMHNLVEAPASTPLPYGLFTAVAFREGGDGRWAGPGGAAFTLESARVAELGHIAGLKWDQSDPQKDVEGLPKTFTAADGAITASGEAFTVYASSKTTAPTPGLEESQAIAERRLALGEEDAVSRALFALLAPTAGPAGASLTEAVALAEEHAEAVYGTQGVIYMGRYAALIGLEKGALEVKGARLVTKLGTPVAVSRHFAPEKLTVTISREVLGLRSEVFSASRGGSGFDHTMNDNLAIAERSYLVAVNLPDSARSFAVTA